MTKRIISGILAIIIILSISIVSFATTTGDLENKIKDAENKIKDAENRIDSIDDEKDTTKSEIDKLNEDIAKTSDEVAQITTELNNLTDQVEDLKKQVEEKQEKYDKQYEALCSRMVAQYKMGTVSYLDVLLSSKSLSDFVSRYYIIGKVAEYDSMMLDQIETQKREIEASKKEVEKKQEEVKEKQAKLKLQEISLTNKKGVKNNYLSQLSAEEQKLQKEIDEANEEKEKAQKEMAEIARKAAMNNSGGYVYTGGQLKWPCPGYTRISSYFGYRGSAATGGVGSSNHKGIDMAAPYGTSILAAEDRICYKSN